MPILSIIVPTYNCCDYLRACVSKLLELKSDSLEFIIVNDGSTDGTKECLDELQEKDSRLRIIHQTNRGVSEARNMALANANGEYLYFCDSDDEIIPENFKKLIEFISTKELDLIVANFLNQNSDLKSTRVYYPRTKTGLTTGSLFLKHSLENKEYGSEIYQYVFKKELFQDIHFVPGILHEDDQVMPRVIIRAKNVLVLNENVYFRKFRLDSLSRDEQARPRNNAKDLIFVINTFAKTMEEYNTPVSRQVFKMLQLRSWMMMFDFFNKVPEKKDLALLAEKPGAMKILFDNDLSFCYKRKYLGRLIKLK